MCRHVSVVPAVNIGSRSATAAYHRCSLVQVNGVAGTGAVACSIGAGGADHLPCAIRGKRYRIDGGETVIVWGDSKSSLTFIYPKTSSRLEGYYYQVKNGVLNRLPAAGYGFNANSNGSFSLFSKQQNATYSTLILNHDTNKSSPLDQTFLPEKCGFTNIQNSAVCSMGTVIENTHYPDNWHKGLEAASDDLWMINLITNEISLLVDLDGESGRTIDAVDLRSDPSDQRWYFVNKLDNALWIFDSTISIQQ